MSLILLIIILIMLKVQVVAHSKEADRYQAVFFLRP